MVSGKRGDGRASFSLHQRTEELYRIPDGELDEDGTLERSVLVLRDIVIYPRMVSPIFITPGENLNSAIKAQNLGQTMIALVQQNPKEEEPEPEDFLPIGVEIAVGKLLKYARWK